MSVTRVAVRDATKTQSRATTAGSVIRSGIPWAAVERRTQAATSASSYTGDLQQTRGVSLHERPEAQMLAEAAVFE